MEKFDLKSPCKRIKAILGLCSRFVGNVWGNRLGMDRPSFRSPKNWPFSTITSPLKMVVTGHPLMSQPSRIGAALAEFTVSKLWYFAGADWLPFRWYCPALRCKLRWRVSFSAQRAGRSYPTYPRLCGWQILLEELTNRRWEQRAYLTGEIPNR